MDKYLSIRANTALYISVFFISIHYVFVYLTNSSTLKYLFDLKTLEILYTYGLASLFGICIYLFLLKKNLTNNPKKSIYIATIIEMITLIAMYYFAINQQESIFIGLFLIHHIMTPYILFNMDILFEAYTNVKDRGKSRGIYLTVWNIPFVITPIIMSSLTVNNLNIVYVISSILLIPFLYLIYRYITNPEDLLENKDFSISEKFKKFFNDKLDRGSFIVQTLLHLYYGSLAVILPIYLHSVFGFDWDKIGLILAFMTAPFILIQIPFGNIEDKKHNEKAILHLGTITTVIFTIFLFFIKPEFDPNISFILFIIFLFVANIGCSLIEISMESMFYKHVTSRDNSALLFLRTARILPYAIGIIAILFI